MDTAALPPLPDILLPAYHHFSGGAHSNILLFRRVSVNPHLRASSNPHPSKRSFQACSPISRRAAWSILKCARRTRTIHLSNPSTLASYPSLGRAPMLVYVRPSNEALLRARVPGAQDQCGCPSHPSHRARSASRRTTRPPLPLPPYSAI